MEKLDCRGIIQLSRVYGGNNVMFGSGIRHDSCIRLSVHKGIVDRGFSTNHYYPQFKVLELEMTPAQFAELITSMNYGVGVPCTLKQFNGERIKNDLKLDDEVNLVKQEYADEVDNVLNDLKFSINSISSEKGLSPKKIDQLKDRLISLLGKLEDESPFLKERFNESLEKTFVEAKASIDNHINLALSNIGLKELHKNIKQIEE